MSRILSDDEDGVVIENRPWMLGFFLIGVVLLSSFMVFEGWREGNWVVIACALGLGAGAFWWFQRDMRVTRLTLHPDGSATLTIRGQAGKDQRHFEEGTLRAAVQTDRSSDGNSYRVMLLIDAPDGSVERLPFTGYFSSFGHHEDVVARIMKWRAAYQASRTPG